MRLLPYGPLGWLVELDEQTVLGYAESVAAARHPDIAELVPAARTVLVRLRVGAERATVGDWLATVETQPAAVSAQRGEVRIPVVYDGEDLAQVATACELSPEEVVARHSAADYVCAFCGFAPGFAYLRGLDPTLRLPRRSTPRTRVRAGAVAIADEYSAVYPSVSPGGWHLIGHTDTTLWDVDRRPPALIAPGTAVRFEPP